MTRLPIPLFGATSIVGYNMARLFGSSVRAIVTSRARASAAVPDRLSLDKSCGIARFLESESADVLIYCDAVCDVEKCERNPEWATEINVGNLERTLDAMPARMRLVFVSSDHVFGGDGCYDEDSAPCPISHYGRTRAQAEALALQRPGALVIRPGLPIGPSLDGRTGHMDWLRYRTLRRLPVTIIEDEMRSAVCVDDLGQRILDLSQSQETGIRHIAATRAVARPELARVLAAHLGIPAAFSTRCRNDQPYPHLGRVELATKFACSLAQPLASAADIFDAAGFCAAV